MTSTRPRAGASLLALLLALLLVVGSRPDMRYFESLVLEGPAVLLEGRHTRVEQTLRVAVDSSGGAVWGWGDLYVEAAITRAGDTGDTGEVGFGVAPEPSLQLLLVDHCAGVTPIGKVEDGRSTARLPFSLEAAEDIQGDCHYDRVWCLMEDDRCELEVALILAHEGGGDARVDWTAQAAIRVAGNGPNSTRLPEELEVTVSLD